MTMESEITLHAATFRSTLASKNGAIEMHMAMVIGGGTVLLGLFLLFGMLWGGATPDYARAAKLFIPVWLVVSLVNMWVGVTKAGYSVREETPILLIVFAVPALLAGIAIWRSVPRTD